MIKNINKFLIFVLNNARNISIALLLPIIVIVNTQLAYAISLQRYNIERSWAYDKTAECAGGAVSDTGGTSSDISSIQIPPGLQQFDEGADNLKKLFFWVEAKTGVPGALLAAQSYQESSTYWNKGKYDDTAILKYSFMIQGAGKQEVPDTTYNGASGSSSGPMQLDMPGGGNYNPKRLGEFKQAFGVDFPDSPKGNLMFDTAIGYAAIMAKGKAGGQDPHEYYKDKGNVDGYLNMYGTKDPGGKVWNHYQEWGGVDGGKQNGTTQSPTQSTATQSQPTQSSGSSTSGTGNTQSVNYPGFGDEAKAAAAIDKYIQDAKPNSPFVGLGNYFINGGKRSNVNPFLAVAHLYVENGFATAPSGWHTIPGSNNAFGRRATASQPHVSSSSGALVYAWSSWQASLDDPSGDDWFKYVRRVYIEKNHIAPDDLDAYIHAYAPPSENNTQAYINKVKEIINKLTEMYGGPLGQTQSNESCEKSGENKSAGGYDLEGMVYYSQGDPQWHNYGSGTIAHCGCGPTSTAMVVATLTGDKSITPQVVADWAASNGHQAPGCGSSWSLFPAAAEKWGLNYIELGSNLYKAIEVVKGGGLVIVSVGPGDFTQGGHIIVLRKVTPEGKLMFADPNDKQPSNPEYLKKSKAEWDRSRVEGQFKQYWGFTKK